MPSARTAVQQLMAAVNEGGALLIHVLNLWQLADGPCLWQKSLHTQLASGPAWILKGVHRHGRVGYVNLVAMPAKGGARMASESSRFLGLEAVTLTHWAKAAGADAVALYGGYDRAPYERESSTDLIVVSRMTG
jgi:hypothetical protein